MKIQYLGDGFANQIRHYVFVRFAERMNPHEKWFFDDSFFSVRPVHNGYELKKVFGINLRLLSEYLGKNIWSKVIEIRKKGVGLPQVLLNMGVPTVMVAENTTHEPFDGKIIRAHGFHPDIIDLPYTNAYYHCYWAEDMWFKSYAEENRRELVFPPLTDSRNLEYANHILNGFSVGIHVRRRDFVKYGLDVSTEIYNQACKNVVGEYPHLNFFIFSDDLDWCRANKKELGFDLAVSTTYVSGNKGKNSYIDMQLLSMCRGIIRNTESSFSQVAGWLDPNLEFEIKLKRE